MIHIEEKSWNERAADLAVRESRLCGLGLKFMRESRNVSIEELADKTGISENTIRSIECGEYTQGATLYIIAMIAIALDANVVMSFDCMNVNVGAKFGM